MCSVIKVLSWLTDFNHPRRVISSVILWKCTVWSVLLQLVHSALYKSKSQKQLDLCIYNP